jgi:hypothetical protein
VRILPDKWWIRDFNNFRILLIHSEKVSWKFLSLRFSPTFGIFFHSIHDRHEILSPFINERGSRNLGPFNIRNLRNGVPICRAKWDKNALPNCSDFIFRFWTFKLGKMASFVYLVTRLGSSMHFKCFEGMCFRELN